MDLAHVLDHRAEVGEVIVIPSCTQVTAGGSARWPSCWAHIATCWPKAAAGRALGRVLRRHDANGDDLHRLFIRVPDVAGVRASSDTLILVTGEDCHLCEHGRRVLRAVGIDAREVDIAGGEARALAARGVPLAFLPVLTDGERVIAYGRLSEKRVRRDFGL